MKRFLYSNQTVYPILFPFSPNYNQGYIQKDKYLYIFSYYVYMWCACIHVCLHECMCMCGDPRLMSGPFLNSSSLPNTLKEDVLLNLEPVPRLGRLAGLLWNPRPYVLPAGLQMAAVPTQPLHGFWGFKL